MSVSITLCTYNGEKFIREQIESYLTQTVLPDEIIVCDDGSSDNTLAIIRKYAEANQGIQWHLIQNEITLGTSRNFEKAISLSSGDFIFFSDQDDIWIKEKVEQTITFFDKNPDCEASFSNATLIDDNNQELRETLLDLTFFQSAERKNYKKDVLLYWSILMGNVMTGATMAIRRTALRSILPFQLNLGRNLWYDGWIGFCLMATDRVGYIDQPLTKYRIHAGQQVGVVMRKDSFEQYIMRGEYREELMKEYFQRYLFAFSVIQNLKKVVTIPSHIEDRIIKEYLAQKKKYFESQSFIEKKLRLLKWHIQGANYISLRDLMTL
ncbi:MAG TPA: glycosyltransferase family 2 protein [Puia sp.]